MDSLIALIIPVIAAILGIILYGKFKPTPGQPTITVKDIMEARTTAHEDIKEWEDAEKDKVSRMDPGSVVTAANDILRKRRDIDDNGPPRKPDRPDEPA